MTYNKYHNNSTAVRDVLANFPPYNANVLSTVFSRGAAVAEPTHGDRTEDREPTGPGRGIPRPRYHRHSILGCTMPRAPKYEAGWAEA
jgi:hypothetical protein